MRLRAVLVGLGFAGVVLTMSACDGAAPSGDAPPTTSSSGPSWNTMTGTSTASSAPTPATTKTAGASSPAAGTLVTKVFDAEAMRESVRRILTEEYLVEDLRSVSCPSGKRVEVDSTFECTARIGDEEKSVPITVTSEKGDYQVGLPT